MDAAIFRSLALALLMVVLSVVFVDPARAVNGQQPQATAYQKCTADMASLTSKVPASAWTQKCVEVGATGCSIVGSIGSYQWAYSAGSWGSANVGRYCYDQASPPGNPCTALSPSTWYMVGQVTNGQKISIPTLDNTTGAMVNCSFTATDIGAPVLMYGKWRSYVTWSSDGNPSGGNGTPGQVTAPNGAVPDTAPPPVDSSNPPPSTAPKVCGGGSCLDMNSDAYKAVDGATGKDVSVPGNTARSSQGGCSSGASSAVCAGSPSAPLPGPPITDPSTQIRSSDTYTQSNPATGANQSVSVIVYGVPGSSTTSGQGAGDVGPSTGSGSGNGSGNSNGDGTSSVGGADCSVPPMVTGSGGMGAIAYQTWKTRCDIENQGKALGTGTVNGLGTLYTPSSDTTQSVVAEFQASVQQAPIAGAVSGFFNVGATGGSCPTWSIAATDYNPELTFDFYCRPEADEVLNMARIVLLIACAYLAFQIAMGDS